MPVGLFQVKTCAKLFLSTPGCEGAFGGGKCCLLDAVRRTGSISGAAAMLHRSYRKAWGDIRKAEEGLGANLVKVSRGGRCGGAAELTDFAVRLIAAWEAFRTSVLKHVNRAFDRHLRELLNNRPTSTGIAVRKRS